MDSIDDLIYPMKNPIDVNFIHRDHGTIMGRSWRIIPIPQFSGLDDPGILKTPLLEAALSMGFIVTQLWLYPN